MATNRRANDLENRGEQSMQCSPQTSKAIKEAGGLPPLLGGPMCLCSPFIHDEVKVTLMAVGDCGCEDAKPEVDYPALPNDPWLDAVPRVFEAKYDPDISLTDMYLKMLNQVAMGLGIPQRILMDQKTIDEINCDAPVVVDLQGRPVQP